MNPLLDIYLNEISKYKILSRREELQLIYLIKGGNKRAFDKLILSNQRFVISEAKKFLNQGLDLSDLISLGNIGLIEGIKRFDPSAGNKLMTYCVWWIKQKIMEGIGNESRLIRLPLNRASEVSDIIDELQQQPVASSYLYSLRSICHSNNITEAELLNRVCIYMMMNPKYRDKVLIDVDRLVAEDFIEVRLNLDTKVILKNKITQLKDRQQIIANKYFDLFGRSKTFEEIGDELKLTRERVRQIKVLILKKLRDIVDKSDFNNKNLIPYSLERIQASEYESHVNFIYELSDVVNKNVDLIENDFNTESINSTNLIEDFLLEELYDQL